MALSKTRTFFDGLRECLNFLSHERGAPQSFVIFPFDIFHSPLPLGEGLAERVRSIEKRKKNGKCFVLAKPSPNPLPEGEGAKMANEKCQMENEQMIAPLNSHAATPQHAHVLSRPRFQDCIHLPCMRRRVRRKSQPPTALRLGSSPQSLRRLIEVGRADRHGAHQSPPR